MHDNDQPIGLPLPPGYHVRDRELPQRLLGVFLWGILLLILWAFGAH